MGFYINEDSKGQPLPKKGKIDALLFDGANPSTGEEFEPNLICVAERKSYDAAIYCYNESEYRRVCRGNKGLEDQIAWITHPKAKQLSHFK